MPRGRHEPREIDGDVTIYRDTWGVPHIYGKSEQATLFGQGYAQAEDRLPTIFKAYRKATGRMAEAFGPEWVEHDYQQHLLGHLEISKRRYNEHSRTHRRMIESFISGIKTFTEENPRKVPEWECTIEPHGLITLGWFIIAKWQLSEAMSKLGRGTSFTKGASNEWAVGRKRSKEGYPMACIDPHVEWEDEWLFHEAHLCGGGLHVYGFTPIGVAYISIGHNEHISWAMTTGGPDTSDVYEEQLSPDGSKYLYDGEWREVFRRKVKILVKVGDRFEEVEREITRTHHGPVATTSKSRAYALRISLQDQVHLLEQIRPMNKAKNLGDFLQAMSMLQLMPQNTMYADVYGNLYYQRTGRVPIRPDGFDWKRPVPGSTSATEWIGIHPMEDLVQILNPPTGFMQNCNISPGNMTFNSPMTAGRYPDYIYNTSWDSTNPRSERFLEIMREKGRISLEDAMEIMVDIKLFGTEEIREKLWRAYTRERTRFSHIADGAKIIRDWDSRTDVNSTGMTLFAHWQRELRIWTDRFEIHRIENSKRLTKRDGLILLKALEKTCKYLKEKFGTIEVEWGMVQRGRRGDRSWPLAGFESNLRSIGTGDPDENGIFYARRGQSCPTLVVFKSPVESYSALPYGVSEDPSSPHYTDQGEKLFARCLLKPTWFTKTDLLKHVESRKILKMNG